MALVNFTNLDFDQIKTSIRNYLKANSNFTDYDFEGSNLSTIIDVLAYNTYISSYNANMISNEVFIDSATLRENVVSLASHIGYTPRSTTSSRATISFFVDTSLLSNPPLTLTLLKGLVCITSSFGSQNYTFAIPEDITVPVVNNIASFDNIIIYEGTYIEQAFSVDENNINQRFILDNFNIDTSTLKVSVRNSQESNVTNFYTLCDNLCDINENSRIYFINEIEDQRYQLIFGDGFFGKKLENLNVIQASYVVTNGPNGNGASSFSFAGRLIDNNGRVVSTGVSLLATNSPSQGGREIESVESIKKFAPRLYSTQKRAVTSEDYETIVSTLYPETESISVFGGEELDPPKYGKVFIAIKPVNGEFLPNSIKENLKNLLRKYSVSGIVTEIIDLKYLYIEFDSTVYYNPNISQLPNNIRTKINDNIIRYSDSFELNKYGARFKYSKFLKLIDESDKSITSNITTITMRRDIQAVTDNFSEYEICFGNRFNINDSVGYNITSSGFRVGGYGFDLYLTDIPDPDLKTGKISFIRIDPQTSLPVFVKNNVGTIDYVKGEIILFPVNIVSTIKQKFSQPIIEVSAVPYSNDVIGLQDLYLQMDVNNSSLNMLIDTISSGSDVSGTIYKTTSSYNIREYIRR